MQNKKRSQRNREENLKFELENFKYFKEHQLHSVDFETGVINTKVVSKLKNGTVYTRVRRNVGSKKPEGYEVVWCGPRLRMKHRLLWWLYTGEQPDEIDHINRIRDDNRICNLRAVNRKEQLQNIGKGFTSTVFSVRDVHTICHLISKGINDYKIADLFGCSRGAIMGIRHKRRHKDIADQYY